MLTTVGRYKTIEQFRSRRYSATSALPVDRDAEVDLYLDLRIKIHNEPRVIGRTAPYSGEIVRLIFSVSRADRGRVVSLLAVTELGRFRLLWVDSSDVAVASCFSFLTARQSRTLLRGRACAKRDQRIFTQIVAFDFPQERRGSDPDRLLAEMRDTVGVERTGEEDGAVFTIYQQMLALAERITGVHLGPDFLNQPAVVVGYLEQADDYSTDGYYDE
jgi:hypothetical protein